MRHSALILLALTVCVPSVAFAHGGKTDDAGCHVDSRTGKAHCHEGIRKLKKKLKEREKEVTNDSGELDLTKLKKPKRVAATVTDVIDGDTIEAKVDGEKWTIRIVGIDCAEATQNSKCSREGNCDTEAGAKATKKMEELVKGSEVQLVALGEEFTKDRYQRVLAYVEHQAADVGLFMIRNGYCEDYSKKYPHPRQGWYKRRTRGLPNKQSTD